MTAGTELVDTIGLIAGSLWLGGAVWWQVVATRRCPVRYSLAMTVVGISLMFGSSALVLRSASETAIVLGVLANVLMLLLAVAVHVHLSRTLSGDGRDGEDDEDDDGPGNGRGKARVARTPDSDPRYD